MSNKKAQSNDKTIQKREQYERRIFPVGFYVDDEKGEVIKTAVVTIEKLKNLDDERNVYET